MTRELTEEENLALKRAWLNFIDLLGNLMNELESDPQYNVLGTFALLRDLLNDFKEEFKKGQPNGNCQEFIEDAATVFFGNNKDIETRLKLFQQKYNLTEVKTTYIS